MDTIIKHKWEKGAVLPMLSAITIIAILTFIIIWYLVISKPQPQTTLETLAPVKVVIAEVQERIVQPIESITGRLQPVKTAQIRFEVSGKVTQRFVEPGTVVKKNQVLMKLDASDYQDQFHQVAAELIIEQKSIERDKELLKLAQNNLYLQQQEEQRLERLVKRNLIAQSQLDSVRQRVFDLQAEVAQLDYSVATSSARVRMKKSQHDIAKRNLARTTLTAAFEGVVNEVFIDEGDYISANEIALTLVDTSEYDVQLDVRGEVINGLQLGQQVEVQIKNKKITGKVVALQLDPDINTNTHRVRVRVASEEIQSGMLATVSMPLSDQQQSLMIPVPAVLNQYGETYVYILKDNLILKTQVKLGRRVNNEIVVHDGVTVGQQIVAQDVASLADQQQVTIK